MSRSVASSWRAFALLAVAGFAICSLVSTTLHAQPVTVTMGTYSTGGNSWPFNFSSVSGRYQHCWESNEIGTAGRILEVRTSMVSTNLATYSGFRLRLAHTTLGSTSLTTNLESNYHGTLETSLGPTTYTPTMITDGGVNYARFVLDTPFAYNGTDNLLIDYSMDGRTGTGHTVPSIGTRTRAYSNGGNYQTTTGVSDTSGNWQIQLVIQVGPALTVAVTPGFAPLVGTPDDGPNNAGIEAGTFTLTNNEEPDAELFGIELTASGTGDDSADYTYVALFQAGGTNTSFDPLTDVYLDNIVRFATDNGSYMFEIPSLAGHRWAPFESRRYFIVVKMGPNLRPTDTYNFQVTDLDTGSETGMDGVPSAIINGVQIEAPQLAVTATPGAPNVVFNDEQGPGNDGLEVAHFQITSNHLSPATLENIVLQPTGTGNDALAYDQISIYRANGTTSFDPALDIEIDTINAFPGNNTAAVFDVPASEGAFAANVTRDYYIVVKLNGTALAGHTFNFVITDLGTLDTLVGGTPSDLMFGVEIKRPTFEITDTSPAVQEVMVGSSDVVVQTFDIEYAEGPDNPMTSLTIRGLGTGNEVTDLSNVRLYHDVNGDGQLDAGDTLITSGAYSLNNGVLTFVTAGQPAFVAPETRSYLVVYDFNDNALDGATFRTYVQSGAAQQFGSQFLGLPSPDVNGAPGVEINANILRVDFHGPVTPRTVPSTSIGPHGAGELLLDFSLRGPVGHTWDVSTLTFIASGSGSPHQAFSEISLFEDTGGGTWDGPTFDNPASTVASSFNAISGAVTLELLNPVLNPGETRRLFLVANLTGAATSGQTFGARLESMNATTPAMSDIVGVPTGDSNALIIDSPALTVLRGPAQPLVNLQVAGADQRVMGQVRLFATNSDVQVNGLTFHTGGTGDWSTDIASGNGFQVWLDNGAGTFDTNVDTLLFEGSGAATVTATFSATVTVPVSGHRDLWVVVNTTSGAGLGTNTTPLTFNAGINDSSDVNAVGGIPVIISSAQSPQTPDLGLIDFQVTSFSPLESDAAGGGAITIEGNGFLSPFFVRIGGVLAMGTANVGGGTQVTGLTIPAGTGVDLPIVVYSGKLPPQTLPMTFDYPGTGPRTGSDSSSDDGGGCVALGAPLAPLALILLGLGGLAARRRRK
jgi:hypothetical protein